MWIEEVSLENIKCFEKVSLRFDQDKNHAKKWITLLGENSGGKSTILQAIGLLLAGPEGANQLLTRPLGWVRDEAKVGKISIRVHKDTNDPGKFGTQSIRSIFGYTFFITGSKHVTIRNKVYTEPTIVENSDKILTWLRQNALTSKGKGWFGAGYGAFRRLTRKSEIIVPALTTPERFTNFLSQFNEDEPLAAFERWLIYLDYRISKDNDKSARKLMQIGIDAINKLLPPGNSFNSITNDGRVLFDVRGKKVATLALSDGFRSVLALGGDLLWRMIESFPNSKTPLNESGVVLIDELDIHLHPTWQRNIGEWLMDLFPNIQFIVATHSPLIAAGAGPDAITYRLVFDGNKTEAHQLRDLSFLSVDNILASDAFSLISPYSPQTERKINRYIELKNKKKIRSSEKDELQLLIPFVSKSIGHNSATLFEDKNTLTHDKSFKNRRTTSPSKKRKKVDRKNTKFKNPRRKEASN